MIWKLVAVNTRTGKQAFKKYYEREKMFKNAVEYYTKWFANHQTYQSILGPFKLNAYMVLEPWNTIIL